MCQLRLNGRCRLIGSTRHCAFLCVPRNCAAKRGPLVAHHLTLTRVLFLFSSYSSYSVANPKSRPLCPSVTVILGTAGRIKKSSLLEKLKTFIFSLTKSANYFWRSSFTGHHLNVVAPRSNVHIVNYSITSSSD